MGRIIPYLMENKKMSKPPTSYKTFEYHHTLSLYPMEGFE